MFIHFKMYELSTNAYIGIGAGVFSILVFIVKKCRHRCTPKAPEVKKRIDYI